MRRAIMIALAVLFIGSVARTQDEGDWRKEIDRKLSAKISVNFQEEPLFQVLDFFRKRGEINVILDSTDPKVRERRVTLKLDNVRLESAISWAARLLELEYAVENEAVFIAARDAMPAEWRAKMQERYREQISSGQESWLISMEKALDRKIEIAFRNQPMAVVAEVLAVESGVNIVLDGELEKGDKRVTMEAAMTFRSALDWVCRLADVKYAVRDEVIYIADQKRLDALRLETGETALAVVFRRPVSFDFKDTPVDEALDRLSRLSGVKIELQGLKPDDKVSVTAKGEKVELNQAVRQVMDATGRKAAISYRGTTMLVVLLPPGKTPAPERTTVETRKSKVESAAE